MFGLSVMAVGVWAWTEKNAFNNLSKLTHLALDPAFALILIGKLNTLIIYSCIKSTLNFRRNNFYNRFHWMHWSITRKHMFTRKCKIL